MNESLLSELEIFIVSFGYGVVIAAVYDAIRVLRRVITHGQVFTAVEDMIFWLWVTSSVFKMMYYRNDGALRLYIILAAVSGMFLYSTTVSVYIVKYVSKFLRKILKYLCKPLKFVAGFIIIKVNAAKRRVSDKEIFGKINIRMRSKESGVRNKHIDKEKVR